MPSYTHHFTSWSNSGEDFDIDHQLAGVPLPEDFIARITNLVAPHRVDGAIPATGLPPRVTVRLRRQVMDHVRNSASLST